MEREVQPTKRKRVIHKPSADGLVRCQRCKKEHPAADFEQGAHRRKRVCVHCEKTAADAPPKPMGRPRVVALPKGEGDAAPGEELRREPAPVRKQASSDPEKVYSKPMRCPKCGNNTRFERRIDATKDDSWTCLANNCQLRIGNYNIPTDRSGKGAAA